MPKKVDQSRRCANLLGWVELHLRTRDAECEQIAGA
jgi:hypothetical protein